MDKQEKPYIFMNKAVFFPKEKILVLGDVHIGYEEAWNKQGAFVPRTQFKEIMKDLQEILDKTGKVKEIVILGDLKHEFGKISEQEWQETSLFLDKMKENCEKIILVKGNHDTILEPIASKSGIEILDEYIFGENLFIHGNKFDKFPKEIKRVFVGHRHPAIRLKDEIKSEIFKVFLVGEWKGKEIIILPSFMPFVEGTDVVNEGENNLPFSLSKFEAYVIGDKIYGFGRVGKIKK